jgi:endo-1,3(4)-beta-glucanase
LIIYTTGFYNDHHFHYGYHIYSAAVLAHFKPEWGRLFYQKVLLMVRDIANPSAEDPFFPTWRHKDFYLGSSWANGIMGPNPNGRNQESSSEAIAAYEAVAMFGEVMRGVFMNDTDPALAETALHVRDMGRLLLATELRSAKTYWHVMPVESNVTRVYPAIYKPRIVGMLWSMLAQEQTWYRLWNSAV